MAEVLRPRLLAYATNVAPGQASPVFAPQGSLSWEVNSIVVSGLCAIERAFDLDGDGQFETFVEVERGGPDEFHGYKFQCDNRAGLRVVNLGTSALSVALLGVEIA